VGYPVGQVYAIFQTHDPLNRLTSAAYSDGRSFNYTYDPSGNVLELEQNLGPGTIITAYTYDEADQLNTAQQGSTTWQYTYDANGSLISDGVKNYTYDSANRLVAVSDQLSAVSLSYNGLGQRLSMDAAGVIAHYVMDGDRPLTAESGGNTTFYLYGLGGIGEKTSAWKYSLPDGTNTPRQLSDESGDVTLSARYTPWGDTLDTFGSGNFTFGYLGGVLDAATGLLYVGNGQYYDPSTGRFLTRDVYPNSPNPYVPWNPVGAILAPLAVLSLFYGRKKKHGNYDTLFVIVLLGLSMGIGLAACGPTPPSTPQPQPTSTPDNSVPAVPPGTTTPGGADTIPSDAPETPPSPTNSPTATLCPYPQAGTTPVPNDENYRSYGIGGRFYQIFDETSGGWWDRYRDSDAGLWPILITLAFYWETSSLRHNELFMAAMQEAFSRKLWGSYKDYGRDGWAYYLGSREPIRRSIAVLEKYKGNWIALEAELQTTYNTSSNDIETVYNNYGKLIWSSSIWRIGRDENRPWEFGNPTEKSPLKLLEALGGKIPSCNGHCTEPKSIYFRDTVIKKENSYINDEGLLVYRLAFVVTSSQQRYFCNNASCVKP